MFYVQVCIYTYINIYITHAYDKVLPVVLWPLQAGLLGGGGVWQQRASLRLRPVLPAQRGHDGRQLLLHLHGGGGWVHLQPVTQRRAAGPAPRETAFLGVTIINNKLKLFIFLIKMK